MRGAAIEATLLVVAGWALVEAGAGAGPCRLGRSWWSPERHACQDCTLCDPAASLLVRRPCQMHRDTQCVPLAELHFDWQHAGARRHRHRATSAPAPAPAPAPPRRIVWHFSPAAERSDGEWAPSPPSPQPLQPPQPPGPEDDEDDSSPELPEYSPRRSDSDYYSEMEVRIDSEPLSDADESAGDWQSAILTLAAFACTLFFVVVAAYSVYHARQWKILKENLEADVEGLSAKLNLMMASAETNEMAEPPSPPPDVHYTNVRCAYLEQLLGDGTAYGDDYQNSDMKTSSESCQKLIR